MGLRPDSVRTSSPICSSSTGRSPDGVEIVVPFNRQFDRGRGGVARGAANAEFLAHATKGTLAAPAAITLNNCRRVLIGPSLFTEVPSNCKWIPSNCKSISKRPVRFPAVDIAYLSVRCNKQSCARVGLTSQGSVCRSTLGPASAIRGGRPVHGGGGSPPCCRSQRSQPVPAKRRSRIHRHVAAAPFAGRSHRKERGDAVSNSDHDRPFRPATTSTWAALEEIPPSMPYRWPERWADRAWQLAAAPCARGMPFSRAAAWLTMSRSPVQQSTEDVYIFATGQSVLLSPVSSQTGRDAASPLTLLPPPGRHESRRRLPRR